MAASVVRADAGGVAEEARGQRRVHDITCLVFCSFLLTAVLRTPPV